MLLLPPLKKEVMFSLWSVCLFFFVCLSDNWKSCERILTIFLGGIGHGPGITGIKFGDDAGTIRIQESKVQNQWILMKFYGELGCGLMTNWLHFGDHPHHYPDLGVHSGSWSGKNCHNSIMLAFGRGLCSLSTSSYLFALSPVCGWYWPQTCSSSCRMLITSGDVMCVFVRFRLIATLTPLATCCRTAIVSWCKLAPSSCSCNIC